MLKSSHGVDLGVCCRAPHIEGRAGRRSRAAPGDVRVSCALGVGDPQAHHAHGHLHHFVGMRVVHEGAGAARPEPRRRRSLPTGDAGWFKPPTPSMPLGRRWPCQWMVVSGRRLVTKMRTGRLPPLRWWGRGFGRCSPTLGSKALVPRAPRARPPGGIPFTPAFMRQSVQPLSVTTGQAGGPLVLQRRRGVGAGLDDGSGQRAASATVADRGSHGRGGGKEVAAVRAVAQGGVEAAAPDAKPERQRSAPVRRAVYRSGRSCGRAAPMAWATAWCCCGFRPACPTLASMPL